MPSKVLKFRHGRIPALIAALLVATFVTPRSVDASSRDCIRAFEQLIESRIQSVEAGVAHIQNYRLNPGDLGVIVSVMVPSPQGITGAQLRDLAAQSAADRWPRQFILSDGYPEGSFLLVDLNEGSPLKREVSRILAEMKSNGFDPSVDRERFLEKIAQSSKFNFISNHKSSLSTLAEGRVQAPNAFRMSPAAAQIFSDFWGKGTGPAVFDLGQKKPVTPFELFFTNQGCRMCIHQALLASLLLEEAGIPHRLRTGFGSFSGPSYQNTGHSLIELADGRILDPTWHFLKKPKTHPKNPEWIEGSGWWWTPNQHFPYLVLP